MRSSFFRAGRFLGVLQRQAWALGEVLQRQNIGVSGLDR